MKTTDEKLADLGVVFLRRLAATHRAARENTSDPDEQAWHEMSARRCHDLADWYEGNPQRKWETP